MLERTQLIRTGGCFLSDNKKTVLYAAHKYLGARFVSFGGWEMPVEYSGISKEHVAVRTASGLFDVSHMGELEIRGSRALNLVQQVTTNDVSRLTDGQAQYSAMAFPNGTVVDDLLVYRRGPEWFWLVVNAGNIQKDFDWITSHNRFDASVENISDNVSLLAVQGPKALDILQTLTLVSLAPIRYYNFTQGSVSGVDAVLSRTGYTGEDGFEIYCSREHAESLWNAVLEAGRPHGLLPAGLGARNTLRLEAGFLLYGNDMDETTTLFEAGLGWIVKLDKGEFVGCQSLSREKQSGVHRKLVGFEMLGREIARDGYTVFVSGREAGRVTSGSPSVTLQKNIGLVYLPVEYTAAGTRFQVSVRGRMCDAQVAATPFYKRRRRQ
jgi:aminomethyltransferase